MRRLIVLTVLVVVGAASIAIVRAQQNAAAMQIEKVKDGLYIITGGRGQYLGMLGGVLLLTALQTMLAGSNLPYATRAILYGLVVLGAVIALRERRT